METMKTAIALVGFLLHANAALHYINNHEGHPFRHHAVPRPKPPLQTVDSGRINKRRLDVWKPIPSKPQTEQPTKKRTPAPQPREPTFPAVPPQRIYVQLAPATTRRPKLATRKHLKVHAAPRTNKPRPRYQPVPSIPQRPVARPPPPVQKSFTPPKLTAALPRKPVILPGYPPRQTFQTPAQDRQGGDSFLSLAKNPFLLSGSSKKKGFTRPLPASFTYKSPALPFQQPFLLPEVNGRERPLIVRSDDPRKGQFEDLLFHLGKYQENDDYLPSNKTAVTKATPRKEPVLEEETTRRPIFPKLKQQDVLNALEAVDKSMEPLIDAANVISSSFSLAATRRQTVEEVLGLERQDVAQPLAGVVDTVQFTLQQVLANPEPLIILSALLLSVITGSAIGNTITTITTSNRNGADVSQRIGGCPHGYEMVEIDEDGRIRPLGNLIIARRLRREAVDGKVADPDRRGYPFNSVTSTKKRTAPHALLLEKEYESPNIFCKMIPNQGGDGPKGVGIMVNSDSSGSTGPGGQVSIKVGGVSVTVGGEAGGGRPARADKGVLEREGEVVDKEVVDLPGIFDIFKEDGGEDKNQNVDIDNEGDRVGGVFDGVKIVLIDSLRQIRSLLVG